jgi:DegV family protein with EDD domain
MKVRITSDSTCDLGHLVNERDIGIMPLQVNLDAKLYRDGVDITPEDIFKFVEETKILPMTSAPSVVDYEEFFTEQLQGYDELVHFNISSKSSGSHNFAKMAAENFGGKVRVIDSKALSSGQGLLVLQACDLRDQGKSAEEINGSRRESISRIKKLRRLSGIRFDIGHLSGGDNAVIFGRATVCDAIVFIADGPS